MPTGKLSDRFTPAELRNRIAGFEHIGCWPELIRHADGQYALIHAMSPRSSDSSVTLAHPDFILAAGRSLIEPCENVDALSEPVSRIFNRHG